MAHRRGDRYRRHAELHERMRAQGHGRRGARCRFSPEPGVWVVTARIERFVEPALLLVLREGEAHGYELADAVAELAPEERIDLGNLYRMLRSLEAEGIVQSRWRDDLPGRAKRTYELTPEGEALLRAWTESLTRTAEDLEGFVDRYRRQGS
jgi:DNA-binding PadR family transcriptional regulator